MNHEHTRDVAWCGWWLKVPQVYRPFKIQGDYRKGMMGLAEGDTPRLLLRWATVNRRNVNGDKLVRRQLLRGLRRKDAKYLLPTIKHVVHDTLDPMLSLAGDTTTRTVGYAPSANLLIEMLYHHASRRDDARVIAMLSKQLTIQEHDQAQRWAFFDVSFIAPARMQYHSCNLKLGDMSVRLTQRPTRRFRRGAAITVRQIYPADLALKRLSLHLWMDHLLVQQHKEYRLRRTDRKSKDKYAPFTTPFGDGLTCDTRLRSSLTVARWRTPRVQRNGLFHDTSRNRLIVLQVADAPERIEASMTQLLDGLHWATIEG